MQPSEEPRIAVLSLPPEERNARLRADLPSDLEELQRLLTASAWSQQEVQEFRERYDKLPKDTPLPPRSLRRADEGRPRYVRMLGRLIALARRYAPLVDQDDAQLARLEIDPGLRIRGVLTSLAAALALYDNYLSMRTVLEDDRLRRLIGDMRRGYGLEEGDVREIVEGLNSKSRRRRLHELVTGYDELAPRLAAADEPDLDFLQMAIESSVAYRYAREKTLGKHMPSKARLRRERLMDALDELAGDTLGALSQVFGNGIGMIETRKGKLWGREDVRKLLLETLQPLDMLLEKTPFRLTDQFIPGHFGHVAIWVGTHAELNARGLWQDALFQQERFGGCEEAVREGRSVLEALRSGVELNSLEDFLNVDDLAILRPTHLPGDEAYESLLRAFRQVGKLYDFNFEVETLDKITCSELPYHVYPDVAWETDTQLGSFTISPDQVAKAALGADAPFHLVALYHDGTEVDPREADGRFAGLLEGEAG